MIVRENGPPRRDAYLVGYGSDFEAEQPSIEEITQRLIQKLRDERVFAPYSRVSIVAHSLGGLIAQNLLVNLQSADEIEKIRSVVCLGTPTNGTSLADLLNAITANRLISSIRSIDRNEWLQALQQRLVEFHESRSRRGNRFPLLFGAFETRAFRGKVIVPRSAAGSYFSGTIALNYDHFDLVKPRDQSEDNYQWILARLREGETGDMPTIPPAPAAQGAG